MEVVIRDGPQNGSWVTNHQETKLFSKKRRVSSEKIFSSIKSKNKSQEAEEGQHRWEHLRRGAQWTGTPRALTSHEWFSPASTACADAGGRRVVVYIYLCAYLRGFDDNIRSRIKETAQTQWLSTYLQRAHACIVYIATAIHIRYRRTDIHQYTTQTYKQKTLHKPKHDYTNLQILHAYNT